MHGNQAADIYVSVANGLECLPKFFLNPRHLTQNSDFYVIYLITTLNKLS